MSSTVETTTTETETIENSEKELFEILDLNDTNNENVKLLNIQLSKCLLNNDRDYGYKLTDARLVTNFKLVQKFSETSDELKRRTNALHKSTGFYIIDDDSIINEIANNGCVSKKCKINYLGDSAVGVYLCKHLDVLLAYSNKKYEKLKLFMFKIVYSKFRLVNLLPNNEEKVPSNEFECHFSNNIPKIDQSLFEQYLNSMMYISEKDSATTIRTILPYALLTFERTSETTKNGHDDCGDDLFDIDNKINEIAKRDEVCDNNIPKTRVHYERTGDLKIKFRGTSKLKIKLNDLLKSNMKFLDEEKTSISLSNSTNRLILAYIDKRKNSTKLTTSKSSSSLVGGDSIGSSSSNVNNTKRLVEAQKQNAPPQSSIVQQQKQQQQHVNTKKPTSQINKPVVNNNEVKLAKKPFSSQQLNSKQEDSTKTNLNLNSTSLEKHLLKSRKNLTTAINSVKAPTVPSSSAPPAPQAQDPNKQLIDKINQQRMLIEMNNKKYEAKKKEDMLRQQNLVKGFWNDYEWKNGLSNELHSNFASKIYYETQMNAMDAELRKLIANHKIDMNKLAGKFDVVNIQNIEEYNPKEMYAGGFMGIEAGKCGTSLTIELHNRHLMRQQLQKQQQPQPQRTPPPVVVAPANVKRIQLNEYTSKMKVTVGANSNCSIPLDEFSISKAGGGSASSDTTTSTPFVPVKTEPPVIVTASSTAISLAGDTTPFTTHQSSSSSSSSNLYTIVKSEESDKKRKLPSTSLIDELKKRIGNSNCNSNKISKYSDNDSSLHESIDSSTNGGVAVAVATSALDEIECHPTKTKTLKRKHKSQRGAAASNDESSTDVNSDNNTGDLHLQQQKKHKKASKKYKQKQRQKSRSSSVSSSFSSSSSSSSSSSASKSTSIASSSQSATLVKHLKIEPIFNTTPNSDNNTKISAHSTTTPIKTTNNEDISDSYYDSFYNEDLSLINNLVGSNSDSSVSSSVKKAIDPSPVNPPRAVVSAPKLSTPHTNRPLLKRPPPITPSTPIGRQIRPPRLPNSAPNLIPPRHPIHPNDNNQLHYSQMKNRNNNPYAINNTAPRFNNFSNNQAQPPPPPPSYQNDMQNYPFPPFHAAATNFQQPKPFVSNFNPGYNPMPEPGPPAFFDDFHNTLKRQSVDFIRTLDTISNSYKHKNDVFANNHSHQPENLIQKKPNSNSKCIPTPVKHPNNSINRNTSTTVTTPIFRFPKANNPLKTESASHQAKNGN